ncbi:NAD(P)-dependent oxidoreductase [Paenibacillus sp. MBLB4367]|uniref:NAD(P)-dependent oxidoreductase n=1 Tax=Paenibacillus sp. MBLB4367 TaxID=3384767 RepID=UPI0039083B09
MKLLILGATGRVGKAITAQAMADGHLVTVLVRDPARLEVVSSANLTIRQGNSCVEKDVFQAVQGTDAVISALSTDGGSVLSESTPFLVAALKANAVRRIVTIGTSGILESKEHPGLLRYETPDSRRSSTRASEEHRQAWEQLSGSDLDWTVVCPTYLPAGERTGSYRVERNYLPSGGASISVADTADFAYNQLFTKEYSRVRVGIAY